MMKNDQKFIKLCEAALTRLDRAGFLVGDVVEISDLSKVSEKIRSGLKEYVDLGLNLRVIDIVNNTPSDKPGSQLNNTGDVTIFLGVDYGGGRIIGRFPVPPESCTPIEFYPNLAPIPDALRRDNAITIKPEVVPGYEGEEFKKQTGTANDGNGKLKPVEASNPVKDTKIPSPTPPKQAVYFRESKERDVECLADAYIAMQK